MYTRAFSTLGCAEFSLEQVLALAKRQEVPAIEVRALGGTLDLPGYFRARFGTPEALARLVAASGVGIAALDTSFKLIGGGAEERAALLEFLPWAEALGVRWLRAFDGGRQFDAAALAEAADVLGWWQEKRRARGGATDLMIETHDLLLDAGRIAAFGAAMPGGRIPLLWDTHHTWRKGGENPLDTWRAIRTHVVHVHVKDSVSAAARGSDFMYVSPGSGEFPMAPLRRELAGKFQGSVSMEWERLWHPDLGPVEDALAAANRAGWW